MCIWRLEQKKINQKINKTLKSLQSTEQDPAASSSFFAQKDSLLLLLMGLTPNIQQAKLGPHLKGRPYVFHLVENRIKHIAMIYGCDVEVTGLRRSTYV